MGHGFLIESFESWRCPSSRLDTSIKLGSGRLTKGSSGHTGQARQACIPPAGSFYYVQEKD